MMIEEEMSNLKKDSICHMTKIENLLVKNEDEFKCKLIEEVQMSSMEVSLEKQKNQTLSWESYQ